MTTENETAKALNRVANALYKQADVQKAQLEVQKDQLAVQRRLADMQETNLAVTKQLESMLALQSAGDDGHRQ